MESLATAVTIILAIVIFSGPIAIAFTFIPRKTRQIYIVRRLWVLVFSFLGIVMSLQMIFAVDNLTPKLIGAFGLLTIGYALKREFAKK